MATITDYPLPPTPDPTAPPATGQQVPPHPQRIRGVDRALAWAFDHGLAVVRVFLGLLMVGFGALKFFPGLSPAEPLVTKAVNILTFGVVSGQTAMVATAVLECAVGALLVLGRARRLAVIALAGCVAGWMSPLVLFPGDLFPAGGPTLAAQYVVKDIVFGAVTLVLAARAFAAGTPTRSVSRAGSVAR